MTPDHAADEEMPEAPDWADDVTPSAVPICGVPMEETAQVSRRVEEPEAPKSDIERFREKCVAAGIVDDKPLYQVMMTLFVASETALSTVRTGARGLTPEGEADLVKRISRQADASMRDAVTKHRLRLERRTSLVAGGIVAAGLILAYVSGYWTGWSSGAQAARVIEHDIAAAAMSAGPQAAASWAALMRNNDLSQALAQCSGTSVWSANGRQACAVPLWLAGPEPPPIKDLRGQ